MCGLHTLVQPLLRLSLPSADRIRKRLHEHTAKNLSGPPPSNKIGWRMHENEIIVGPQAVDQSPPSTASHNFISRCYHGHGLEGRLSDSSSLNRRHRCFPFPCWPSMLHDQYLTSPDLISELPGAVCRAAALPCHFRLLGRSLLHFVDTHGSLLAL